MRTTSSPERLRTRPSLSIMALISFVVSFMIARIFTTISPDTVLVSGGYHIHHFWYGLVMLAVGGWLGISYESPRISRLAAVLFGAGGGLIGDEVGLLLTLESESYWADVTYTIAIMFVTLASILILFIRYQKTIRTEFAEFLQHSASFYVGVFLAVVSAAFLLETDNMLVLTASGLLLIVASVVILAFFIQRIRLKL